MILFYTFQGKNSIEKGKNLQGVYEVENRQRSVAPFAKRERPNGRSPIINYVICSFIPLVASCMHKPSENITISVVYTFLFSDYKQMTVCSVETVYLIHRFSSDSLCPPGKAFPFPRQLLQRSLLKIFLSPRTLRGTRYSFHLRASVVCRLRRLHFSFFEGEQLVFR